VLAGWYHTVTEHERSGTVGAADDPWHAAAGAPSSSGKARAYLSLTPRDVALRQVGAAAPAAQSA
jgi:hypothetical protein